MKRIVSFFEKNSNKTNTVLTTIIVTICCLPFLKLSSFPLHTFFNILLAVCCCLLFLNNWFFNKKKSFEGKMLVYSLIFFGVLTLETAFCLFTINVRYLKTVTVELFFLISPFFAFCFIEKKKRIYFFVLIISLITFDNVLLTVCGTVLKIKAFVRSDIAYSVVYGNVVFLPLIVSYFLKNKDSIKTKNYFLLFGAIAVSAFTILFAGFMLSILIVVVAVLLSVGLNAFSKKKQKIIYWSITIGTILLFYVFGSFLLPEVAKIFYSFNKFYYDRILDIYSLLYKGEIGIALDGRLEAYSVSIKSFNAHPLEGTVWYIDDRTLLFSGISYHSTFLDSLALFGGVFFPLILLVYFLPFVLLWKKSSASIRILFPCILSILLLGALDNLPTLASVIGYLFSALCLPEDFRKKEKEQDVSNVYEILI